MLRAIWFMIKVGILVSAAVWVANRPGMVAINWLGYDIRIQLGFALLALLIVLLLVLVFYKLFLGLFNFRKFLKQRAARRRERKGLQAFMRGLSAVAAGDASVAAYQADRMRRLLPDGYDEGLSLLLDAQAARVKGDHDSARLAYGKLSRKEDTALLGLRGLIVLAIEQGDVGAALSYVRQASKKHRRKPWVLQTMYALQLREGQWEQALLTLQKAQKQKVIAADAALSGHIAILLQQSEEALAAGKTNRALRLMEKAHRLDSGHIPAAAWLARAYLQTGKRRKAVAVIKDTWPAAPHPELADLWHEAAPKAARKDSTRMLSWHEKLVALRPDAAESQLAIAGVAVAAGLWGEARQYLDRAEQITPDARLYRLRAQLEENLGHIESSQAFLKKAADAPPEKVWTCRETGRVYDRWSPVAQPHGAFNTIVWSYPRGSDRSDIVCGLKSEGGLSGDRLLVDSLSFSR